MEKKSCKNLVGKNSLEKEEEKKIKAKKISLFFSF